MVQIGDLIEVTSPVGQQGVSGIIESIRHNVATVRPVIVESTHYISAGDDFEVNLRSLTQMPTQAEIRREKVALRAQHIASLTDRCKFRPGNIRQFPDPRGRAGRI